MLPITQFVDNNADLNTLDYITKSMSSDELEKAVDRTKLVQVERTEKRGGKTVVVKRWVKPDAVEAHHKVVGNAQLLDKQHPQYKKDSPQVKAVKEQLKAAAASDQSKQSVTSNDADEKPSKQSVITVQTSENNSETIKQKVKDELTIAAGNDKMKSRRKATKGEMMPWKAGDPIPDFILEAHGKIPPNWCDVEITTDPSVDLWIQAKDSTGRPQKRYKPEYEEEGQQDKWQRCVPWATGDNYDKLHEAIKGIANADAKNDAQRQKNIDKADCLHMMLLMGIRPSSERNTGAKKKAYGATTLQANHVVIESTNPRNVNVYLRFTGKDGVEHDHQVKDSELKKMLIRRKHKAEAAGGSQAQLFGVSGSEVRATMHTFGLEAKDLRTICAIHNAKEQLKDIPPTDDPKVYDKTVKQVCEHVCKILGNRRQQTYKSYIPQTVWQEWSPQGHKNWQDSQKDKKSKKGASKNDKV